MFCTQYDEKAKLWSGLDIPPLYNPKISLGQALLKACEVHGPKIAQINDNNGIQLSFDDIRIKSVRAAQNLQKRGYVSKQVYGILARNSHHLAPIVFASFSLGCSVNALDISFGKTELMHMLNITKPSLMFCDSDKFELVKESLIEVGNDAKIFTFGGSADGSESVENLFEETKHERTFVSVKVDGAKEVAIIGCSSGTTGLSKGVCLSHAGVLDAASSENLVLSSDVEMCFSSLYWISGWIAIITGTLNGATRIITTETFTPELYLRFIEQYKVTFAKSSPHHLSLVLKSERLSQTDLSSMRMQWVAGGKCSYEVQHGINSALPNGWVYTVYGLTEANWGMTFNLNKKDCVGQLLNCYKVKIVDDDGNRCGIGENGEICFKANYPFLGYFNNQKATDEVIDDEGFVMTADIGHFDEDGDLFVVDRKKDLIKYCGYQISPSQIESFLIGLADIQATCVVGIPDKTNDTDLPTAFIVRAKNSTIAANEIYDMVAGHFADYCKLRGGVYFVDSLPTTPSGKILRRKVREQACNFKQ